MTLSIAKIKQHQMIERFMNNNLERNERKQACPS